jgi:hypothetical protein
VGEVVQSSAPIRSARPAFTTIHPAERRVLLGLAGDPAQSSDGRSLARRIPHSLFVINLGVLALEARFRRDRTQIQDRPAGVFSPQTSGAASARRLLASRFWRQPIYGPIPERLTLISRLQCTSVAALASFTSPLSRKLTSQIRSKCAHLSFCVTSMRFRATSTPLRTGIRFLPKHGGAHCSPVLLVIRPRLRRGPALDGRRLRVWIAKQSCEDIGATRIETCP